MKLGDMTFKQIAEICYKHENCDGCPFHYRSHYCGYSDCRLKDYDPCSQNLNMEVNTDAEE